jgi:ABC-2 type transport system ATP-binding protein
MVVDQSVIVKATALRKHFRSGTNFVDLFRGRLRGRWINVLRGLDFEIRRGEILGIMGPNGAGKSTLLRLLCGLLVPDSGSLLVFGKEIQQAGTDLRRRVCFINCDERSFSWRLSGLQNLEFFAALCDLRGERVKQRIARALEVTCLGDQAQRPVREYSSGMRQRLALARGLLGDPELFLFDEPTRAVDPVAAMRLRRLIKQNVEQERHTAIVATHNFEDVYDLCNRVLVLDQGIIACEGTPEEATRMIGLE